MVLLVDGYNNIIAVYSTQLYGWFAKHVPTKVSFLFLVILKMCTKLTFGLFHIYVFSVFERHGINRVGLLLL